MLYIIAWMI